MLKPRLTNCEKTKISCACYDIVYVEDGLKFSTEKYLEGMRFFPSGNLDNHNE